MAVYIPLDNTPQQFIDSNGDPYVNGSLEFYLAGTSTATDLYSDDTGTSIGTSISLNSLGYPESGGSLITLFRDQSKALKVVLKDSVGATVWTMDDIPATAAFDSTSSTKLGYLTVTQAVDLDTMESDLATAYQVDGSVATTADLNMGAATFFAESLTSGITASVTQTQGSVPLTSAINEVSTCANANDTVTLPTAVIGRSVTVINNGAATLQVFPAADDQINSLAVDAATTIPTGCTVTFTAFTAVKWESSAIYAEAGTAGQVLTSNGANVAPSFQSSTSTLNYGAFYHDANATAFVINAQTNPHCYHNTNVADGNSSGWTFDAGGAGTSVAIASIADGADSGVDIEVTTTGNHNLAVNDVISQTNLTDAAYEGIFVVKAIISNTQYEVAAVYTATDTGTMDQAATLTLDSGGDGNYILDWSASATSATSNETFDYWAYKNAALIPGAATRRNFGTAADFGSMSGSSVPFAAVAGDKLSFVLANNDSAGNLTLRNLGLHVIELT